MTPDGELLLRWCLRAGSELVDLASRAGSLAVAVAVDWADDHGRAWSDRIERVRRELDAAAGDAAHLGRHLAQSDGSGPDPGVLAALAATGVTGRGPRLAGTDGARVDGERGMRLAELPDDPPR